MPSHEITAVEHQAEEFPLDALLPKDDTQLAQLVAKNPTYDGRGTVIAILDTGVDPAAPGLEWTTVEGERKILDLVDCTGSGDVALRKPHAAYTEVDRNGTHLVVAGLSGRKLKLNKDWKNPTNEWRLGLKSSADLFPKALLERLKKARRERFEQAHGLLYSEAASAAAYLSDELTNDSNMMNAHDFDPNYSPLRPGDYHLPPDGEEAQKKAEKDLRARKETLKELLGAWEDPGWLFDCVVWHDGERWRAAVDTGERGDLRGEPALTNFIDEPRWHSFGDETLLTFSVNVYDEGTTLSIVTLAGSHGTHVAAIAAAHHPEQPSLNGTAPGARVISLKIGDTRLGSMETGAGLIRAATYLATFEARHGVRVDVANMSYGESAAVANAGRFAELLQQHVVNEAGCLFVSSAGNAGPALTTVGAPGGTTSHVLGVGAFVTPRMVAAEYALADSAGVGGLPYTWSSRPVAADGAIGVGVYAPGAAITSVPRYTVYGTQLMNGTSMSSPNASGCLAAVISALKQEQIPYTPYRLLRGAVATTRAVRGDDFGVGMLQVERLLTHLRGQRTAAAAVADVVYDLSIDGGAGAGAAAPARGIYLRGGAETVRRTQFQVHVQPHFMHDRDAAQNAVKLGLEQPLALRSDADWVEAPEFVHLNNGGRTFPLVVDAAALAPGRLYTARVDAFNDGKVVFSVPVTVCKPAGSTDAADGGCAALPPTRVAFEKLRFGPGDIQRKWVAVPAEANWAAVTVRAAGRTTPARFLMHLVQLAPQTRHEKHAHEFAFSLGPGPSDAAEDVPVEQRRNVRLLPGTTLEVCLAQFWSSAGETRVSVELEFHGVSVGGAVETLRGPPVTLTGAARVDISSTLRRESLDVRVSMNRLRRAVRPKDAVIAPLRSRDVLPDGRQVHALTATYEFSALAGAEGEQVTPSFARLNDVLYDSVFDSVLVQVHDCHKRVVAFQDVYGRPVKLAAGSGPYTLRLQVASRSVQLLEALQQMVLTLEYSLPKAVTCGVFPRLQALLAGEAAGKSCKLQLRRGDRAPVFVAEAAADAVPKGAQPGDVLLGELSVLPSGTALDGPLFAVQQLVLPAESKLSSAKIDDGDSSKPSLEQQLAESVRDARVAHAGKFTGDADGPARLAYAKTLSEEFEDHLPAQLAQVAALARVRLASKAPTAEEAAAALDVVTACDSVRDRVNVARLAEFLALKHDAARPGAKREKQERERERDALVHAFAVKMQALLFIARAKPDDSTAREAVRRCYRDELAKWAVGSTEDPLLVELNARRHLAEGHLGLALQAVWAYVKEPKNISGSSSSAPAALGDAPRGSGGPADYRRLIDLLVEILGKLRYQLWVDYFTKQQLSWFPGDFAAF